ncbi:succinate dehydrogenase, cytochrome b556 subunit [Neisseria animalis]|uniref:Succinate dehydrogenase cytochrome b556 subunit n=1 Tax=Neisseria animalis TaxID=492 RepID=A0A5P3MQY1_NEIAN|nr:succinate dehydrogenase, cytochrome b556 subunit [Neisseria animalis]QEY23465.1 succinate dehydrogenase, cytochrome b556 subunit [Neisseria animalis]ROW33310.1 succinate dehydrogenase, cytochrome b556 subunit [Neisseria animalis]VEE08999.1 putative succinate dehydrogenase cytochrome B subunit [Neisseria animalis]
MAAKPRPVHLDLPKIRLPIPGIVSILHRISGVLLFIALPLLLGLLAASLDRESVFESYLAFVANPIVKLGLIVLLWAFLHHACAGTRFLFLDAHKGLDLKTARLTAKIVLACSLTLTVVIGALLW